MPFLAQKHMKTAENRLVLGLFSLFFLFLQSCSAPPVLDELNTFENNRWHMDSTITVEWAPQDAETPVFMGMYVRHLSDYPYNNLYLFRTIPARSWPVGAFNRIAFFIRLHVGGIHKPW